MLMLERIEISDTDIKLIRFTSRELSAICPVDTRPDIYRLEIEFTPKSHTLEMHSLRRYLLGYRNVNILAENLIAKIWSDVNEFLEPLSLHVKLANQPENGIGIEIEIGEKI